MTPKEPPGGARRPDTGHVAGWLLGRQLAHGHHGFPGNPLLDGHLGSPADLAFWAGLLELGDPDGTDDDETDDDEPADDG